LWIAEYKRFKKKYLPIAECGFRSGAGRGNEYHSCAIIFNNG
jgi:hypothetical protein